MTKRKPPQPDMNTFPDEHSQTDRLAQITKENDMKSPTHIVDGEYINEWLFWARSFPMI